MTEKCGECGRKDPNYERKSPEARKEELLLAAIEVSKEKGYRHIVRSEVAERAGVSTGLIQYYFGSIADLRSQIMHAAVDRGVPEIVFQGLAVSDTIALNAPIELRAAALKLHVSSI